MENIWKKILEPEEKIIEEFSLGKRYILFLQIILALLGLVYLTSFWPLSVFFFLIIPLLGWFFKKANLYAFSDKRVLVRRGWPSTHLISIDYDKITDISIQEPFLERLFFKTGHLSINTAGTGFQEVTLKHVDSPYELKKKLDRIRDRK
jgi:uncharacterized membrane protein YdbT with pleckstrin-like domain